MADKKKDREKELIPNRPLPARGVMAGVKGDFARAKESGETYNPNAVGTAWTHNFL